MSLEGQCDDPEIGPNEDLSVCTFPMPAGTVFDWHTHDEHQLAWASSGVLTVRSGSEAWVLPPTRALWIPAGVRHETLSDGVATMRTAYLRPESFPDSWRTCTPVEVSPHLREYNKRIVVGFVEPQYIAGFSGGRKMVVPSVASPT